MDLGCDRRNQIPAPKKGLKLIPAVGAGPVEYARVLQHGGESVANRHQLLAHQANDTAQAFKLTGH